MLANVLIAAVAHFNQALMLWCAFLVVDEEEEVAVKKNKQQCGKSLSASTKW